MHPEFQERVIGQKKREEQGVSAKKEEEKKSTDITQSRECFQYNCVSQGWNRN